MKIKIFILSLAVLFIAALSTAGLLNNVYAEGNTGDSLYTFNNTGTSSYTDYRRKKNDTKVYVHPTNGFTLYYTVQGWSDIIYHVSGINASDKCAIPIGEYASITNYVYENGLLYARLHLERYVNYSVNTTTTGLWSPDSTQNYNIYGD